MYQNIIIILLAAVIVYLALLLLKRQHSFRNRVLLEDTLKNIVIAAFNQQEVTVEALAGTVSVPRLQMLRVVDKLQKKSLVNYEGLQVVLTDLGRARGLRLLRAHRLIERYLHDEANMPLNRIHAVAERHEHRLSDEEISDLDARLGYPQVDPHGDPIPTPGGKIPKQANFILSDWPLNWPAQISQINDQPSEAFAKITGLGLLPSSLVTIVHTSEANLTVSLGGSHITLSKVLASSIQVRAADDHAIQQESYMTLTQLPDTRAARVMGIHEQCKGLARRRLLDLGITPGAVIAAELAAPGRSARAYRVRGTLIALRQDQASQIAIEPLPKSA